LRGATIVLIGTIWRCLPTGGRCALGYPGVPARGIHAYAFVGPLLPHFRYDREALNAVVAGFAEAGVESVFVEHINLSPDIKQRVWKVLNSAPPEVPQVYRGGSTAEHRQALDSVIVELIQTDGLKLRLSKVLYHKEG
jgi:DNA repair photolyase